MKILVTGALGQIGSDLVDKLCEVYGSNNIISSDIREKPHRELSCKYLQLDIMDRQAVADVVIKEKVDVIYHLAALLSATGEKNPMLCFDVNVLGLLNILEVARELKLKQIVCPSSIAVFGEGVDKDNAGQMSPLYPSTMYGISKVTGELLCDYYFKKFGVDARGLRYPGLISYKTKPGGGTTDYAVEIFYDALKSGKYECFLKEDTFMPMMYMDDAIRGTIMLSEADSSTLQTRSNFNFSGISFSPAQIADAIKKHIPNFVITYKPDFRQAIADSWPKAIDDSEAKKQWGWKAEFDLAKMTKVMLQNVKN